MKEPKPDPKLRRESVHAPYIVEVLSSKLSEQEIAIKELLSKPPFHSTIEGDNS